MTKTIDYIVRHVDYKTSNDDFPTPPWATRAFFRYVAPEALRFSSVLEPAAGRGRMTGVLEECFAQVEAADMIDYGKGYAVKDYVKGAEYGKHDLMMTNPPFRWANEFALRGLREARLGVAVLVRTLWLESATRHHSLFLPNPPTTVAIFSKRMFACRGRVSRKGGAITSHCWVWWDKTRPGQPTRLMWVPPDAQSKLERDEDYE